MIKGRSLTAIALAAMVLSVSACGNTSPDSKSISESSIESSTQENTEVNTDMSSQEQTIDQASQEQEIPALRDAVQEKMGCRIGCAITGKEPWDPKLWDLVTTHFNAVTLGNELKPDSLFGYSVSKCPGTKEAELNGETITVPVLNYQNPEKILNKILKWNEANPDRKIEVRGHVL